jgi:hypothetical protein
MKNLYPENKYEVFGKMIELKDFIFENWFWLIILGFLFGIGFELGGQLLYPICDIIKEKLKIPLG